MNKKIFLLSFVIFLMSSSLFAADGVMWGEKDIRVIQTEWFDIIYGPESAESAAILYENADRIYTEISEFFEYPILIRMPVVLSPKTERFNAYFMNAGYGHIVLYDTVPSGNMIVFTNSLLSTFRHELSHAFSYNLKGKSMQVLAKIYGDGVHGGVFSITSGWAEGAAVTSESSLGEGRLNEEYAKHIVKQAKIEGKFPKYADVQGSSDKYPAGSYYYFNSAFDKWLQDKYGVKKYADFWYRCINLKSVTAGGAFKKNYGMSINAAWALFKEDVQVPLVQANPLLENIEGFELSDFFSGSTEKYSSKNISGALYSSLSSNEKALVYVDEKTESVWHVEKSSADETLKINKLFSHRGLNEARMSEDGRYVAFYYTDDSTPTYLLKSKIYDVKNKKFIDVKGSGLSGGTIVQYNDQYFLVSLGFHSQNKWIDVKRISETVEDYAVIPLKNPFRDMPVSFCQTGDGEFAVIIAEGLEYKIYTYSVTTGQILKAVDAPFERMALRDLSCHIPTGKLLFSWTRPGSMPSLGLYDLHEEEFSLFEENLSGGVFTPVIFDGKLVYTGQFYRQNRLFSAVIPEEAVSAEKIQENNDGFKVPESEAFVELSDKPESILSEARKYNPFTYLFNGAFIPAGRVFSYNFNPDIDNGSAMDLACNLPLGLTYYSENPWDSNNFELSAGYSPFTNSIGTSAGVTGGTDTSLFKWQANVSCEFDLKGYKQAAGIFAVSFSKPFGRHFETGLGDNLGIYEGRSNPVELTYSTPEELVKKGTIFGKGSDEDNTFFVNNTLSFWLTNAHKTGTGYFEYSGFRFQLDGSVLYHRNLEKNMKYSNGNRSILDVNLSPAVFAYIPRLIPVENRDFYCYNLPVRLGVSLYPSSFNFMAAKARFYLFSVDFQKALPFFSFVFVNRLYFSLGYNYEIAYKNMELHRGLQIQNTGLYAGQLFKGQLPDHHSASLIMNLVLSPNIGSITGNLPLNLQAEAKWTFKPYPGSKADVDFFFGVQR